MLNKFTKRAFCTATQRSAQTQSSAAINVQTVNWEMPKVDTEGLPISLTAHPENTSAAVVDAIKTPISHPNAGYQIVQPLFQMMPDAQIMDPSCTLWTVKNTIC